MTAILGISAFYHDSAAAIVVNGKVIAAAQQERYSRIKHDASFPKEAISYCLIQANMSIKDLDAVVFYDKPLLKFERLLETFLGNAPRGFRAFARAMPIWLKEKLYLKSLLRRELRALLFEQIKTSENLEQVDVSVIKKRVKATKLPQLYFTEHHQSHAAAAFYPSPFTSAAVVCLDGVGEWASSSIWRGENSELVPLAEIHFPHSLGLLYSAFTYFCGFKVNSGEYKLMGLAPYGKPKYVDIIKEKLVHIRDDGSFTLDMQYFDFAVGSRMTNAKFAALFNTDPHPFDAPITQVQMDLASSIQVITEEIVLKIAAHAKALTACSNLCLAGGVALNCVANGKLLASGMFENIWVQPAAGDAGSALGGALQVWHSVFKDKHQDTAVQDEQCDGMQGAYLGDEFNDEAIIKACESQDLPFELLNDQALYSHISEQLAQDKVVGWFQGRMEFGPRALGNRSILGDPRSANMQSQMNLKIKQRESFRPFAPAVLAEDAAKWFDLSATSPYMLMVANVREEHRLVQETSASALTGLEQVNNIRSKLPAITHVDYSARVQTVHENINPRFYALLSEFKRLTNIGMLINTSFNVRGEPPVRSPQDAIRCFLATDMDILVMCNTVLYKTQQPALAIERAKRVRFAKD
ncbi:carbamoyltransferase [Glaciecola siphonariae]|uniref:Carbamoyltransferase n=1 Tax=Glaciecola siphonariae TaxID=521012 RepID=A0ABV9LTH3_9ALTE